MSRLSSPWSVGQLFYLGRVGLAVAVAYLLSHGTDPAGSLYAVLAAALVVGETTGDGMGISRNRLVGTVIGVLVAAPVVATTGPTLWAVPAACVIAGLVGLAIGEIAGARIAMTVVIVSMLTHPEDTVSYGLFRLTNTAVGVAVAVAVGYIFWPFIGREVPSRAMRAILNASTELLRTIASSDRTDLRQRRQRALFRALAASPKARKEADQDPLLRWRSPRKMQTMPMVAEIGVYVLTMSAILGRMPAAHREAAWWPAFAEALAATADSLNTASRWLITHPSRHEPAPVYPPLSPIMQLAADTPAREVVETLLHDLQTTQELIADLGRHVRTWDSATSAEPGTAL